MSTAKNDEAKLWYMKWDCNAWTGSTGQMSAEQCGIHFNLLNHSWMNNAIKDDESLVWIAHASLEACRAVLFLKWVKGKDGWTNRRLEHERREAKKKTESGKQAAGKRWNKPHETDTENYADSMPDACRTDAEHRSEPMRNGMRNACEIDASKSKSKSSEEQKSEVRDQNTDSLDTRKERGRRQVDDTALNWSIDGGWRRTEQHRAMWTAAYPAVNLDLALAQSHAWLIANPTKARKSNWVRFATTWLSRDQDRGGGAQSTVRPYGSQRPMESDF